ncbi:hypothetical protein Y1Q_0013639 [Alligator mississippiensis]|uniref:ribonuclease H n=1 Tax=Alligator mississippiensis TaxID=8496 RepID=A0A151P3S8_ALLMI|nr:hypothetical protein Y1Q_0013639 [Alligator mississippiensis]
MEHKIRIPPGALVRERWRSTPQQLQEEARQEIDMMQRQGIIPLVSVSKPCGSLRLCVDYQKLNVLTAFDAFPMPHIAHLLEKIGETRYIFTIALAGGYWQILMRPSDCAKTAFRTPWALFEFLRMPFGLKGAAATFQRLTDSLLAPDAAYADAYIKDIVIFTTKWTQHLHAL